MNPYSWLTDVMARIADHPARKLEDLLPSWAPPLDAAITTGRFRIQRTGPRRAQVLESDVEADTDDTVRLQQEPNRGVDLHSSLI